MGESIRLVRSFSQPSEFSSHETTNEAIPHRVLTESVSFGRFASETLSWEKWSAFTQNRYLEEVQRFTKPGSVAQKKAFFEAHFKNRAAAAGKVTQTNKISDEIVDSEVQLGVVNNGMAMDEIKHEEVSNAEVDSSTVPSVSVNDDDETTHVQIGEVKVTTNVENLNSVAVTEDDEENSTLLSKERPLSSSGSKACCTISTLKPSFYTGMDRSLENTRKESSSRPPDEPFHVSISCAPSGKTDKTVFGIPQNGSRSNNNAKSAGKAEKKKISSSARKTTKRSPKKLARNSTTEETNSSNAKNEPSGASKSLKRPLPRASREGSKAAKCSTSASAARLPEVLSPKNQLENKRKKINVGSSVSCRILNNVQRQPSVSCENLSTHSRTTPKSLTVSSPFNFRCDERAEKRKEFFKKLEEKNKKEDTEKDKISCGFKANQNTHFVSEEHKNPQVSGFKVPLISLTSPRFRRNHTPGTKNIKKSHRSPHKVSPIKKIIINTKKAIMEKQKSCKIHPASRSQTTKMTQENMSPNIPQN